MKKHRITPPYRIAMPEQYQQNKKLFISYSRGNKARCAELAEQLKKAGYDPWFDEHIKPGEEWWQRICREIEEAQIFIVLCEPILFTSIYCKVEYEYAKLLGRHILPVKIALFDDKDLPAWISNLHYHDLTDNHEYATFGLIGAINSFNTVVQAFFNKPEARHKRPPLPQTAEVIFNEDCQNEVQLLLNRISDNLDPRAQFNLCAELEYLIKKGCSREVCEPVFSKLRALRGQLSTDASEKLNELEQKTITRRNDSPRFDLSSNFVQKFLLVCVVSVSILLAYFYLTAMSNEEGQHLESKKPTSTVTKLKPNAEPSAELIDDGEVSPNTLSIEESQQPESIASSTVSELKPSPVPAELSDDVEVSPNTRSTIRDPLVNPLTDKQRDQFSKANIPADPFIEPEMIAIKAGSFIMGSGNGEGAADERPAHKVNLAAFELAKNEVTFAEYDLFAKAKKQALPDDEGWGRGSRPVMNVSWSDALDYIAWLNERSSKNYRLPSEAEWEYAARAGTQTPFYTGECIHTDQANYNGKYDYKDCGAKTGEYKRRTVPVEALHAANDWGLRHMAGNVWEWTQDCWHGSYSNAPNDGSAWLETDNGDCERRVLRGGGWSYFPTYLRSAFRFRGSVDASSDVGFRVARTK